MKKVLIIYPHFPPSNLAGVHRPRLFAQHLPEFGWEPVILTVHEDYYEEEPDLNLVKLLPAHLRIEKVKAFGLTKPRIIGDIGLRSFFQLFKKAKHLILTEHFDFVYIPIPSFYCALLGRRLHESTGIRYGIDYIDPWVHHFPGSENIFSRHWISGKIASLLEPIAIKKASLITGVAEGYFQPVLKRNPLLQNRAVTGAMPYGGEERDHEMLAEINVRNYLFSSKSEKFQLVYAGAMLPKAYALLERILKSIAENMPAFDNVEFHFIGTGRTPHDPEGFNIRPLALKYGLWERVIFEYPRRIPYLDVLAHLRMADGIFILGSTEPHYTPSKSYQGVLSGKPVLAVLHSKSTAVSVLRNANAGMVLDFAGENDLYKIEQEFPIMFNDFRNFSAIFRPDQVNRTEFEQYSARNVTRQLADLLDQAILK